MDGAEGRAAERIRIVLSGGAERRREGDRRARIEGGRERERAGRFACTGVST